MASTSHHSISRRTVLRAVGGSAALAAVSALGAAACSSPTSSNTSSKKDNGVLEIMAGVSSPVAGAPPQDWFWKKLVKDAVGLDVKLTLVTDFSQYYVKLQARSAANDLPDLFQTQATTQSQLAAQGIVADWTPFLVHMSAWMDAHDGDRFKPVGTFDGKLYGLTARTGFPYKPVVVIRKDWLDKLGLQVPKTLDDYATVMKAFTTGDPNGNGKKDTYGWTAAVNPDGSFSGFGPLYGAFDALSSGSVPWRKDGDKLTHQWTTDNFKSALQFIHELDATGVIDPDWKAQKGEDVRTKFQSGRVGLLEYDWAGALAPADYINFHKANPRGVLQIIDPPIGPNGAQAADAYSSVGQMFGMSQRAADAGKGEKIAKLMNWLAGEGYMPTVAGQEGKDKGFQKGPDGAFHLNLENADYYKYWQLNTFALKGDEAEFIMRYGAAETTQGDRSVWKAADWIRAGLPDYPRKDVTPLAAAPPAPPDIAADLTRTLNEGAFRFATGARPFSEWPQFVAEAKRNGLDQWTQQAEKRIAEVGTLG